MMPSAWREGEVAVIGLARSGMAATRLLRARGVSVYASDRGETEELSEAASALTALGAAVDLGGHDLERVRRATVVIVSPGVAPDTEVLRVARDAAVPVHSEVELAYLELSDTQFVAVTGTNGKSTTTALLGHVLQRGGVRAEIAGNIGRPLSAVALESSPPAWVALEVSSFQLHDLHRFAPQVGVLTNLAANHLDRYSSVEAYYADKARLFLHASEASTWVLNGDDDDVRRLSASAVGRRVCWSLHGRADAWYDRDRGQLMLAGEALLSRDALALLGDHNVGNALAAALAARAVGLPDDAIADAMPSFRPLPHRLEPIRETDGVLWINDSKATSVTATARALEAMTRPPVLLLGGHHKGESYASLAGALAGRHGTVVAFGEAARLIEEDLARTVRCERATSFDDAVTRAHRLARPGDVVLLSPACSSYDAFRNFEERGERFRSLVELL